MKTNIERGGKQLSLFFFILALSRKQIGLTDMLGVFIVLVGGIVVAFMALVGEIFWNRRKRSRSVNQIAECA